MTRSTPTTEQRKRFDKTYKAVIEAAMETSKRDPNMALEAMLFGLAALASQLNTSRDHFEAMLEYARDRYERGADR